MTTPSATPGPRDGILSPVRPATTARHGTVSSAPYAQPPRPPKKRRTGLIVLLVILAVMLIGIVGCAALIGTAGKAITEGTAGASQSQQAEDDKNSTPVPAAKRHEDPYAKLRGEPGFLNRADFGEAVAINSGGWRGLVRT